MSLNTDVWRGIKNMSESVQSGRKFRRVITNLPHTRLQGFLEPGGLSGGMGHPGGGTVRLRDPGLHGSPRQKVLLFLPRTIPQDSLLAP